MGLTIHWRFEAGMVSTERATAIVEQLRQRALDMPLESVSELIELKGKECRRSEDRDEGHLDWLKTQATQPVDFEIDGRTYGVMVEPKHMIAFNVRPGDGCEDANFGLCRYPKTIKFKDRRLETGQHGWCWQSFCKTQYASNPTWGGMANFLRCHLSVVHLLDHAKESGILKRINDEGDYWEKRDPEALIEEVGEWNQMIAGHVGALRDAIEAAGGDPRALEAAIMSFSTYEHLEADARLADQDKS